METLTQTNAEVIQQIYADFQQGNVPAIQAVMADDVTVEHPEMENVPYARLFRGKRGVAEFLGHLYASTEFHEFAVEKMLSDEHTVVALGHLRGTVRATGKPVAFPFAHRWELTDGRVTSSYVFADTAQILLAFQG